MICCMEDMNIDLPLSVDFTEHSIIVQWQHNGYDAPLQSLISVSHSLRMWRDRELELLLLYQLELCCLDGSTIQETHIIIPAICPVHCMCSGGKLRSLCLWVSCKMAHSIYKPKHANKGCFMAFCIPNFVQYCAHTE